MIGMLENVGMFFFVFQFFWDVRTFWGYCGEVGGQETIWSFVGISKSFCGFVWEKNRKSLSWGKTHWSLQDRRAKVRVAAKMFASMRPKCLFVDLLLLEGHGVGRVWYLKLWESRWRQAQKKGGGVGWRLKTGTSCFHADLQRPQQLVRSGWQFALSINTFQGVRNG